MITATIEIFGRAHFVTIFDGNDVIGKYTLFSMDSARTKCKLYQAVVIKVVQL